jgi:hypothetical protein
MTPMLSACIIYLRAYAEGIQNEHLKNGKTDADAEHARKKLIPNGQGAHQGPDTHPQCTHHFLTGILTPPPPHNPC